MILDAPPNSTAATLRIARAADIVILPTGLSLDDLQPSVLLAHELVKNRVPKAKIGIALCRVGDSHIEVTEAQNYIGDAGYTVLKGSIPEKIASLRHTFASRLTNSDVDLVTGKELLGHSTITTTMRYPTPTTSPMRAP